MRPAKFRLKIIVLFYDDWGKHRSVAMSHLFATSLPDTYSKSEDHLSQQTWLFSGLNNCGGACVTCHAPLAEKLRAAAEDQVKRVMMEHCF